jgi:peptidoglycan/xylan/chitin deacetylase (PgdA/CDA1 family)
VRFRRIIVALALAAAVAGGVVAWLGHRPEPARALAVTVSGNEVELPHGITLEAALHRLRLAPQPGDLLDVQGQPLARGRFPGYVLLDGAWRPPTTMLRSGDRIAIVDGLDRREPVRREMDAVPEGRYSNPQFFASKMPGTEVTVRGALSGKVLFAYFRPGGRPLPTKDVALTFDDGPWPGTTKRILSVLHRMHAPATFFTIGTQVERDPGAVRAEAAAGMAVGDHSYSHPEQPAFSHLGSRRMRAEIAKAARAVQHAGDRWPTLFRPPGGSYSDAVVSMASGEGMRVVLWSVDPKDWQAGVRPRQIVTRVLHAVRPGSIVLLHDGGGNRSATVKALPRIISGIRRMGLHLVSLA